MPRGAADALDEEAPEGKEQRSGHNPGQHCADPLVVGLPDEAHLCGFEFLDQGGVIDADRRKGMLAFSLMLHRVSLGFGEQILDAVGIERPRDGAFAERNVLELTRLQKHLEIAVRQRLDVRRGNETLKDQHRRDGREQVPKGKLLACFHGILPSCGQIHHSQRAKRTA